MVRELHEGSRDDGDDYGAGDFRPERGGSITSITSRQELVAYIGHDSAEFFHRLDDAGKPICGNCKRDEIVRCPHIPAEVFASTGDDWGLIEDRGQTTGQFRCTDAAAWMRHLNHRKGPLTCST